MWLLLPVDGGYPAASVHLSSEWKELVEVAQGQRALAEVMDRAAGRECR